jgi:hypothetical protein
MERGWIFTKEAKRAGRKGRIGLNRQRILSRGSPRKFARKQFNRKARQERSYRELGREKGGPVTYSGCPMLFLRVADSSDDDD